MTFDSKVLMGVDQMEVPLAEEAAAVVQMIMAADKAIAAQMKVAFDSASVDFDVDVVVAAQMMIVAADEATAPQTIIDYGEMMAFAVMIAAVRIMTVASSSLLVLTLHHFPLVL